MPELPEVEGAARVARRVAVGRTITSVCVLHRSQRRHLPAAAARSLVGDVVRAVERRGKVQLFRLTSGRTLAVHFRMTGDWVVENGERRRESGNDGTGHSAGGTRSVGTGRSAAVPHARLTIAFDDGGVLVLDDPRALAVVTLHAPHVDPVAGMGPEANGARFTARWLMDALAGRRASIKAALLDQGIVAGVGNIYASEALWIARVNPKRQAGRLTSTQYQRVVRGVRHVLARALRHPDRYYNSASAAVRFNVYDRAGEDCRRCRTPVRRIVQGQRSTYYCPACQP